MAAISDTGTDRPKHRTWLGHKMSAWLLYQILALTGLSKESWLGHKLLIEKFVLIQGKFTTARRKNRKIRH
jgi:hypothetical protein